MNKLFLPYDVYERHKKVSEFIGKNESVLDIGGELNHLSQFIKTNKLIVANLNTGDVIIKKNKLPFNPNSFDTVCSIDVLEHIPKKDRRKFFNQLLTISKKSVILSFPIGTTKHIGYEIRMLNYLKRKKMNVTYLEEHVKNGLPGVDEVKSLCEDYKYQLVYSGNLMISEFLFKLFIFDPKIKIVSKIIYFLKLFINFLTNNLLYLILANKKFSENVNRAYLIIRK